MSRNRHADGPQLPLLELIRRAHGAAREEPYLAPTPDERMRAALLEALRRSSRSRAQVADRMTELLGQRISEAQINAWTAPSHTKHRFPAAYLGAFCRATGSLEPLRILVEEAGSHIVGSDVLLLAESAQAERRMSKDRKRRRIIGEALDQLDREGL